MFIWFYQIDRLMERGVGISWSLSVLSIYVLDLEMQNCIKQVKVKLREISQMCKIVKGTKEQQNPYLSIQILMGKIKNSIEEIMVNEVI